MDHLAHSSFGGLGKTLTHNNERTSISSPLFLDPLRSKPSPRDTL
jgi:hypothetical protein